MPLLLERLKKSIQKKQWISESKAFAFATAILEKNGYMKPWTQELTAKGKLKQSLPEWTKWIPSVRQRIKMRLLKK